MVKAVTMAIYVSPFANFVILTSAGEGEDIQPEPQQDGDVFSPSSPLSSSGSPSTPVQIGGSHGRSISISVVPCSVDHRTDISAEEMCDAFSQEPSSPPTTRAPKTRPHKSSHTPPPPSRKLRQLLPNIVLTKSKSQESQLASRIEEPATHRWVQS